MLTQPDRFDVALLHLDRPVFYQDNIIPVGLLLLLHLLFLFLLFLLLLFLLLLLLLLLYLLLLHLLLQVCLPPGDIDLAGQTGLVAGWGKTDNSFGKTGTNILHKVTATIIT